MPSSEWAYLLTLNALIVVVVQIPLVTALRAAATACCCWPSPARCSPSASAGPRSPDRCGRSSASSSILSLGETLLSPVASAEVADLAPEAVRGRYMGVWTVVWNGGAALGPAFGGWAMDTVGGREAFVVLLVVGLAGAGCVPGAGAGLGRRRQAKAAEARATA